MKTIFSLLILVFLFACTPQKSADVILNEGPSFNIKGSGVIQFTGYEPLSKKPVNLWYFTPQDSPKDLQIVLVFHGAGRNANDYRDNWIELAKKYNLLIIAPEFSKEFYPKSRSYNLGNMFDEDDNPISEENWSYSIVEPIFDFVVTSINGSQKTYDIFGHSAGSQFVHRLLTYKDNLRANRCIAANAGWYTFLDQNIDFPYGLKNSIADGDDINRIMQKNLIVLLGDIDTLRTNNLRVTPEADTQGLTRYARGHSYFYAAEKIATALVVPFNWQLDTVPYVGHDNAGMALFIAPKLYAK